MRYLFILLTVFLTACETGTYEMGSVEGFAPVYASAQSAKTISVQPARNTESAGKIYAYNQYLFQVEQGRGIHIIDNSNPQQAQKIAFLSIPLCTELAVYSNHLYTNNLKDLVVFNLSNISSPQLVSRTENAFPDVAQNYPPAASGYFECVDPDKGVVVGWEQKILVNPKCRR